MGYVPPGRAPERLMLWGDAGSHKTSSILDIAKRLPDATFRIVECDWTPSVEVMLDEMSRYAGLTNVEVRQVFPDDYDDQLAALKWLRESSRRGDWCAFDSFTHTWEASQTKYIEAMFPDESADDFYMRKRAEQIEDDKRGGNLDGQLDWPRIKSWHDKLYREISKNPAHMVCTYEQVGMNSDRLTGTNEEKGIFARERTLPKSRKQFAHVYRSIVHLEVDSRSGEATYTTHKDRARELQKDHANGDFFRDYMVAVAGWHLEILETSTPTADPATEKSEPDDLLTPQLAATPAEGEA